MILVDILNNCLENIYDETFYNELNDFKDTINTNENSFNGVLNYWKEADKIVHKYIEGDPTIQWKIDFKNMWCNYWWDKNSFKDVI